MKKYIGAFTLMELMVVVVLLGIIIGFSIPNYNRSIQKAHEEDIVNQLLLFREAAINYYGLNDGFYGVVTFWGDEQDELEQLRDIFNVNLIENNGFFRYHGSSNCFFMLGHYDNGTPGINSTDTADDLIILITNGKLDNSNPCCIDEGAHLNCVSNLPDCSITLAQTSTLCS